jgi:pimeloyl-ACP methyl ester carboxylesterase
MNHQRRTDMKKTPVVFALLLLALLTLIQAQTEGFVEREDGARIYYQVQGEGTPMMLIHGYPLNSGLFRDNVAALAANYQVITPDLRGFGKSEAPNEQASIEVYAQDMLAVLDQLGLEQAVIGGMSMGGMTLFEMYRQAPERFTGAVLIDTAHLPAGVAEADLWRGYAKQAQQLGVESLVMSLTPDMLTGATRSDNKTLVDYLGGLIKEASLNGAVGGGNALAARPDSTATLASITVPTLIIVGLEDTVTPLEVAQQMNQGIAGSQLTVIPSASHAATIEKAEDVNKAILEWAQTLQATQ